MLVAFSFSSITCFRMVRDDLMASFNVMDCSVKKEKGQRKISNSAIYYDGLLWIEKSLEKTLKYLNIYININ